MASVVEDCDPHIYLGALLTVAGWVTRNNAIGGLA